MCSESSDSGSWNFKKPVPIDFQKLTKRCIQKPKEFFRPGRFNFDRMSLVTVGNKSRLEVPHNDVLVFCYDDVTDNIPRIVLEGIDLYTLPSMIPWFLLTTTQKRLRDTSEIWLVNMRLIEDGTFVFVI